MVGWVYGNGWSRVGLALSLGWMGRVSKIPTWDLSALFCGWGISLDHIIRD